MWFYTLDCVCLFVFRSTPTQFNSAKTRVTTNALLSEAYFSNLWHRGHLNKSVLQQHSNIFLHSIKKQCKAIYYNNSMTLCVLFVIFVLRIATSVSLIYFFCCVCRLCVSVRDSVRALFVCMSVWVHSGVWLIIS